MKKGIHIMNPEKQKHCICHRTTFYSIFDMSSCIKPKFKMICQKSQKSSEVAIFLTNSGQKSVTMSSSSCFNNCSIEF